MLLEFHLLTRSCKVFYLALLAPATADGFLASHGLLWRSYFLLVLENTPIDPFNAKLELMLIWTLLIIEAFEHAMF